MTTVEELVRSTSFDEDLLEVDKTFTKTHQLRNTVIDKLSEVIGRSDLSHIDITNMKAVKSVATFVEAYNSVLGAQETAIRSRAKLKLDKTTADQTEDYKEALKAMFNTIHDSGSGTPVDLEGTIQSICNTHGSEVTEEELRTDPYDLKE